MKSLYTGINSLEKDIILNVKVKNPLSYIEFSFFLIFEVFFFKIEVILSTDQEHNIINC